MKQLLAFALLLAPVPAAATVSVETANGDWSQLPALHHRGYDHLSSKMMQKLFEISSEGKCVLPGRYGGVKSELNLSLSFAAHFEPDGTLTRVILPKLNCPEGEGVIGGALLEMMKGGDYRPTGKNLDGWYRGEFSFSYVD
jgi:hypothetical protein